LKIGGYPHSQKEQNLWHLSVWSGVTEAANHQLEELWKKSYFHVSVSFLRYLALKRIYPKNVHNIIN